MVIATSVIRGNVCQMAVTSGFSNRSVYGVGVMDPKMSLSNNSSELAWFISASPVRPDGLQGAPVATKSRG